MMTTHSPTWASCVHPLLGMMILCKILIYKDLKGIRRMLHEVENVTIRFLNLVLRTVPVSIWFALSSIGNTLVPHEARPSPMPRSTTNGRDY